MSVFLVLLLAVSVHGMAPLMTSEDAVPGRYIVKLKSSELARQFEDDFLLHSQSTKTLGFGQAKVLSSLETSSSVLVMELNYQSLDTVRNHPSVEYVEEDGYAELEVEIGSGNLMSVNDVSYWGLDRINQKTLPLDGNVSYSGDGYGVNIYIIDSGIKYLHTDFESRVQHGFDVFGSNGDDCLGHGTQVAGIVAGKTYGVAKAATLYSVRTLDCNGVAKNSDIAKSIDWVTDHGVAPCVATLALSTRPSQTIDTAIQRLAESGCIPVTAASNEAITVGASKSDDTKAWFSRYGICVDIFAPGYDIKTTSAKGNDEFLYARGTSVAAPFVAGVAAIHLGNGVPPAEVRARILNDATLCEIPDAGRGSPNRFLYIAPGLK